MTTYYSRKDYTYAGGDRIFSIPFSYIKKEHIEVLVNGETIETYAFLNTSQISLTNNLKNGDIVTIKRATPIRDKMVVFSDTSILKKDTQNLAQDQVFDAVQEIYDNNTSFKIDTTVEIEEITTTANNALTKADTAVSTANTATTTANNAVTTANTASSNASSAVATANAANTKADNAVSTANTANTKADSAVSTANSADTKATSAKATAEGIDAKATEALATANEAASQVAGAVAKADTAKAAADGVVETATEAKTIASTASTNASTALTTANTAKSTAEGIDTKATQALTKATTAETNAASAKTTAEGVDAKATQAQTDASSALSKATEAESAVAGKQELLVSGTNIKTINGSDILGSGNVQLSTYHPPLLSCMWSDHLINDIQWLRADTFSWQSGLVYTTAYNKLVEEYATGNEETEGSITFKRSTNGFKIATADYETAILEKYNTDGIAWYYILDTTNKRFKLPRTKFGFEGLRTNVGDDIDESLPNIRGTNIYAGRPKTDGGSLVSGAFQVVGVGNEAGTISLTGDIKYSYYDFDASRSSSTYQDDATVQERATQMYLYFYVGEYAQSAIEQTAGLNAELFNGKLDKTGDTMSGNLIILKGTPYLYLKDTNFDFTNVSSTSYVSGGVQWVDNNGNFYAYVKPVHDSSNKTYLELKSRRNINGTDKINNFIVGVDGNGKAYYNRPQIITDYINGTSGYRIWSNGYCEQWGHQGSVSSNNTISFTKTFKDTNYCLMIGCSTNTNSAQSNYGWKTKTASSFVLHVNASTITNPEGCDWRAYGYLASGQY